jgi:hypothetical protein
MPALSEPFQPDYDTHGGVHQTFTSHSISFKRPRKDISRRSIFTESSSSSSSSSTLPSTNTLSSTSSTYTPQDANVEVVAMRAAANKLLQTCTGVLGTTRSNSGNSISSNSTAQFVPLTPEAWFDAEEVLQWWASQRTVESVEISLQLLEFLVREQEKTATAETANVKTSPLSSHLSDSNDVDELDSTSATD